jgi:hypothetical protein
MEWRVGLRDTRHISESPSQWSVLVSVISLQGSLRMLVTICLRYSHLSGMVVQHRVCKCSVLVSDYTVLQCFNYSLSTVSEVATSIRLASRRSIVVCVSV